MTYHNNSQNVGRKNCTGVQFLGAPIQAPAGWSLQIRDFMKKVVTEINFEMQLILAGGYS